MSQSIDSNISWMSLEAVNGPKFWGAKTNKLSPHEMHGKCSKWACSDQIKSSNSSINSCSICPLSRCQSVLEQFQTKQAMIAWCHWLQWSNQNSNSDIKSWSVCLPSPCQSVLQKQTFIFCNFWNMLQSLHEGRNEIKDGLAKTPDLEILEFESIKSIQFLFCIFPANRLKSFIQSCIIQKAEQCLHNEECCFKISCHGWPWLHFCFIFFKWFSFGWGIEWKCLLKNCCNNRQCMITMNAVDNSCSTLNRQARRMIY